MSSATTASASTISTAPLALKKVRTTAAAKKDAPKAPRAKKAATGATKSGSKTSSPTRPQSSRIAAKTEGDDLDNITSGIKKITLVTKQQKEARAREKKLPTGGKQAASPAEPQSSSLPVTPGEAPPQELVLPSDSSDQPNAASPALYPGVPQQDGPVTPTLNIIKDETPPDPPLSETPTASDVFVQYQPEGPAPETITPTGPLNWLPVNSSATPSPAKQSVPAATPSPVKNEERAAMMSPSPMKRGELPVFTPTSQLRFAPRTDEQSSSSSLLSMSPKTKTAAGKKMDGGIEEVPETPQ